MDIAFGRADFPFQPADQILLGGVNGDLVQAELLARLAPTLERGNENRDSKGC